MPTKREAKPLSEFFKFRNMGQAVAGQIDKFGHSGQYDTDFMVLTPAIIKEDRQSEPKMFGSVAIGLSGDLLAKIDQRKDVGIFVSIEFTHSEPTRKGSPKRVFDVNVLSAMEFTKLEERARKDYAGNVYKRERDEVAAESTGDDDDLPF